MKVKVLQGRFILAVSGGVDSMALLDILAKQAKSLSFQLSASSLELVVAHFNHNIRADSTKDGLLVKQATKKYRLKYEHGSADLGPGASEETARITRYAFLKELVKKHQAKAIITAHHQDDLIETAFINVIRGTNRLGLSAIMNNAEVLRPLLGTPKSEIREYALVNNLKWHEDSSNSDTDYLRNYLRLRILPKLTLNQRETLISNIDKVAEINKQIDNKIATLSHTDNSNEINRNDFTALPSSLGNEVIAYHLKLAGVSDFDSVTIKRLNMAIRTSKTKSLHSVKRDIKMLVGQKTATFITP